MAASAYVRFLIRYSLPNGKEKQTYVKFVSSVYDTEYSLIDKALTAFRLKRGYRPFVLSATKLTYDVFRRA